MSGTEDNTLYERVKDEVAIFMPDQTNTTVFSHSGVSFPRCPSHKLHAAHMT